VVPVRSTLRPVTLVAAALTLGASFGHVLELPQKMAWDADLWVTVEHSLYKWFGVIGGPLEVLTVVCAIVLAVRTRLDRSPSRGATAAAALFALALVEWAAVVQTANGQIGSWSLDAIPADWTRWRAQWEYGHAGHFVLLAAGFLVLLHGSLQRDGVSARELVSSAR
jgi:hypothetical protein